MSAPYGYRNVPLPAPIFHLPRMGVEVGGGAGFPGNLRIRIPFECWYLCLFRGFPGVPRVVVSKDKEVGRGRGRGSTRV